MRAMESSAARAEGTLRSQTTRSLLLVAMPALDEQETVAELVGCVPREIPGVAEVAVLVVDDGSRDETAARARAAGAEVIRHPRRQGVGAAFHTILAHGIERGADWIATLDADGQFDPRDIPALIAPVVSGQADFATASRFVDPSLVPRMPRLKRWGNRMMSHLISRLAGQTFYDVSCGMRCYSRRAMLQLHLLARFTYTQEVFLNLAFKNLRIVEVPIRVRGERAFGESRVAGNLWAYAWRSSQIIFRCYRDYHPLRFFGGIAVALFVPALGLGGFLLWHYLQTGGFSPHKWAGFAAIGLIVLALLIAQIGVVGDMLTRHRVYLEELLYRQRSGVRTGGDGE